MEKALNPLLWVRLPLLKRLRYFAIIYLLKVNLRVRRSFANSLSCLVACPSQVVHEPSLKVYPCRPKLTHRIYFPETYQPGECLPLYINIHGGGFAFSTPEQDEEFCVFFSNRFKLTVISISYSLTPWATLPVPTQDVAAIVPAILSDFTLPIDHSRVAIGGFSEGGNLALSACQLPPLQGKIKAAIPWYAPVDWSVDLAYKLSTRPYKRASDIDGLANMATIFTDM